MAQTPVAFYDAYTSPPPVSKAQLTCLRKRLFTSILSEVSSSSYAVSAEPAVTIKIETPVLRSSTPRQIVKRMNDVMKPSSSYFRNCSSKMKARGMPKSTSRVHLRTQEVAEVPYSLTKLGIAQKKIEHHAMVHGVLLAPPSSEESKSTSASPREFAPTLSLFRRHGQNSVQFGHETARTWKQRARLALTYTRTLGLERKRQLRGNTLSAVLPKSASHSFSPALVASTPMTGEDCRSLCTEQSESASSSSTNSPEIEARQKPMMLSAPKIRLIAAAGRDEIKEEDQEQRADNAWASSPLGKLISNRKKEKPRRATIQTEVVRRAKCLATFEMNMEKLAFEHVLNSSQGS